MNRKRVYMSHPLGAPTNEQRQTNRRAAAERVALETVAAEDRGEPITPMCSWITLAEIWSEETGRRLGLTIDCDQIETCDELWLLGPRREPSPGMTVEINHAKKIGIPIIDRRDAT